MVHYLWLMFGSSTFAAKAPSNPDVQLEKFGYIPSANGGSALKTGPVAGPWNDGHSSSVKLLVDTVYRGTPSTTPIFLGCGTKSSTTRCWMNDVKSPPPGDSNWMGLRGDCSAVTFFMAIDRSS